MSDELKPCPFCGAKISQMNQSLYCGTKDCLWNAFGKLSVDNTKEWQNAYCWKALAVANETIRKQAENIKELHTVADEFLVCMAPNFSDEEKEERCQRLIKVLAKHTERSGTKGVGS